MNGATDGPRQAIPFYENLEALRGICAVLVVFYHVEFVSSLTHNTLVRHSWLFVDFFFVLSGFVITLIHGRAATGFSSAKRFLLRRFFRLYPLHLATALLVGALLAVRVSMNPASAATLGIDAEFKWLVLANLAMVHAWGLTDRLMLNVPSWSVSTEWAAYLLTATIFSFFAAPRWRIGALALVGLGAFALLAHAGGAVMDGPLVYRLPRCLYGFALGAIVYYISPALQGWSSRLALAVQLVAIAAIGALMFALDRYPDLALVFPPLAAVLLVGAITDRTSALFRLLTTVPAQLVGRLSYSIYLTHIPILMVANFTAERLVGRTPQGIASLSPTMAILATLLALATILLVSLATHRWIEVPWRDRGRRLTAAPLPAPAPGAGA